MNKIKIILHFIKYRFLIDFLVLISVNSKMTDTIINSIINYVILLKLVELFNIIRKYKDNFGFSET